MRTSKEQKLINFITGTKIIDKDKFDSVISIQEIIYGKRNAYFVVCSHYIHEDITTCSNIRVNHSDVMKYHKGEYEIPVFHKDDYDMND